MSLGNLFKKFVKDLIIDAVTGENNNSNTSAASSAPAAAQPAAPANQYAADANGHYEIFGVSTKTHGEWTDYFGSVLADDFSDYSVEREVPASALDAGAHPKCKPVSFLMKKNGSPVLAIMLVTTKSYRWFSTQQTESVCRELGIPTLRFYEQCENNRDYVADRIRKAL
ncbi:MAG: hypothetical protein MJ137_04745 [Clostridia bacterium]|nr:hypothetical protein [Clostridia bacterium]